MKFTKEALIIVAIAVLCGVIAYFVHPKAPSFQVDRLERELEELLLDEKVLWVDARADVDFAKAHLEGALSLNEERWEEMILDFLESWDPEATTIVYCSSQACLRSHEVAKRLIDELGIGEVYVLKGGWERLLEAGMVEEAGP